MYSIIGADGKEYGPITEETIRQWIQEHRLDAQSQIKPEGAIDWTTVGALPAFAPLLVTVPPVNPAAMDGNFTGSNAPDISFCFSKAFEVFKANPGLLILATLLLGVAGLLLASPNFLIFLLPTELQNGLFTNVFSIPSILFGWLMVAGFFKLYLNLYRGLPASLGDLLAGVRSQFVNLVLGGLVGGILIGIGMLLCILPGIVLSILYAFAPILILEKGLNFWEAMETSRKMVMAHFIPTALLVILVGLGTALGAVFCLVGLIITVPLFGGVLPAAYLQLFESGESTTTQ